MTNRKVKQLGLTAEQKAILPQMLSAFLLVTPQQETAQVNLQKMVNAMDDRTKMKIYEMAKEDLTARIQQQIGALQAELERM